MSDAMGPIPLRNLLVASVFAAAGVAFAVWSGDYESVGLFSVTTVAFAFFLWRLSRQSR
jgi:hypothetical protein